MLKSSEFNSAVPKFTNGNYASNPIDPTNIEEPTMQDYVRGVEPLETLPAQWWNWLCNQFTSRFNKLNTYVKNIFDELTQLLSLVNVSPDGTESAITTGQLKNAFKELYPTYVSNKLELGTTYVKRTTTVNGHALSSNVTVSKSDVGLGNVPNVSTNDQTPTYTEASSLTALSSGEKLSIAFGKLAKAVSSLINHIANVSNPHNVTKAQVGLGSVVNTGDSATPIENGTTKFTTGGAYTLKKDLTDIAESLPTDAVLHYSFDEVPDYPDGTADVRLIDNNTFDIQSTNYRFSPNTFSTTANDNGKLKVSTNTNGNNQWFAYMPTQPLNKIVKIRFTILNIDANTNINIRNGYDSIIGVFNAVGTYEIAFVSNSTSQYPSIYFYINGGLATLVFDAIYIGDGSYSTPIIDNANGQYNATNSGGIAVKGVSGKGLFFVEGAKKRILTTSEVMKNSNSWTISFWINLNEGAEATSGNPRLYTFGNIEYCFINNLYKGYEGNRNFNFYTYIDSTHRLLIGVYDVNSLLGKTIHIAVETTINTSGVSTKKVFINGEKVGESSNSTITTRPNVANYGTIFGGEGENQYIENTMLDDFQIFDRALTENEVMALYLNKANTPKYYGDVPVTRKVNGYTLDKDITLAKSDVGLGSVVNTGDSATPVSGGTTKFTTGGAYNLLTSLAPIFSTSTSYAVGDMVTYNGVLYTCTTAHSAGVWNASNFTVANLNTEFQKPANNIAEDFQINKSYEKGHLVIYNKELYKCTQTTYTQLTEWDATKFQKVGMYTKKSDRATSLTRYVLNVSLGGQAHLASLPDLCAGSELFIRLDNDNNRSGEIGLEAHHAYTLGVTYSDGGMSTLQKLTSGQELSVTVPANSYLEVSVNYIDVDGDGLANFTMLTYPIPSADYS